METQVIYFERQPVDTQAETLRIGLKQSIIDLLEQDKFKLDEHPNLTPIELFAIILREFQLYYQYIGTRFQRLFYLPGMYPFARDGTRTNDRLYEFYFRFVPVDRQGDLLTIMEQVVRNPAGLDQRITEDLEIVIGDIKMRQAYSSK